MSVDQSLPKEERITEFLRQIKNPYCFKCGKLTVRAQFADNGVSLEKEVITPPENEELRLTFESKQSELTKVRHQLLEKIQWIRDTTTSF